jgi:shikimate dehydrogenase
MVVQIDGATQLLGLIGNPVAHSLSPAMHNAALAALGFNFAYLPFAVSQEDVHAALRGLQAIGVRGVNVTIPHKQAVLPYLQEISAAAQRVGAVNTVYPLPQGGWGGTNTDIAGFTYPLRHLGQDWSGTTATVLGSGGAARAVVQGCVELGCDRIVVAGRSPARLAALVADWPLVRTVAWHELSQALPSAQLVVNATPIGMHTATEPEAASATPLAEKQLALLPPTAVVYDLVYVPRPTHLLQLAAEAGLTAIDGLEMLVQQGASALSLWLGGREVPVDAMRQAALQQLASA